MTGALALAAGTSVISAWADGVGQDIANACILGVALAMLAWHCIWVSNQGQQMAREAQRLGASARDGARALWALSLAVALAVLREGAETVLFVAGLTTGGSDSQGALMLGAALGLGCGVGLGLLLYLGLSRIRPHHLFPVTNTLILLLAASIASQLARTVSQAGWVDLGSEALWDSSAWLSETSPIGTVLHAMVGYSAQPSALQLGFYVLTLVLISAAARHVRQRMARDRSRPGARSASA